MRASGRQALRRPGALRSDVIVTSFSSQVVAKVTELNGDLLTGWLVDKGWVSDGRRTCPHAAPRRPCAPSRHGGGGTFQETDREEVALLPWTVNDAGSMRWLLQYCVLGIITDRVAEAVRVRAASGAWTFTPSLLDHIPGAPTGVYRHASAAS